MDIEAALSKHLLNDQGVSVWVHDRVFMLRIPEKEETPAVVIQVIDSPRTLGLSQPLSNNSRIQVTVYADGYKLVKNIAKAVDKSLDYFRGLLGENVKSTIYRANMRPHHEPQTGLYRADIDFFVMHK